MSEPIPSEGMRCDVSRRDGSVRKALIVTHREVRISKGSSRKRGTPQHEYYVHYIDQDRRLDEWVSAADVNLDTESRREGMSTRGLVKHHSSDRLGGKDPTLAARLEFEREEITKVKNIPRIQLGTWAIDAWYYAPFPQQFWEKKLYFCDYCLKYTSIAKSWQEHRAHCKPCHPPGELIYDDNGLCLWELDGNDQVVYCQNLCLLSKLFLDHKTLFFHEVDPFMFYVLTQRDVKGKHELLGYFSKEKHSLEEYNLACILTLPPHQRSGYGKLLISLSYEITKREGKVGSPEKPLSDLGKLSYRSYWTYVLISALVEYDGKQSLNDISQSTGIKLEDVISTLQALDLIRYWRGQHIIYSPTEELKKQLSELKAPRLCDPTKLTWVLKQSSQEEVEAKTSK